MIKNRIAIGTLVLIGLIASSFGQNELSKAKSFSVDESLGTAHLRVEVVRPNLVKVVLSNNHGRDGMYLFDGKDAYEYHNWTNSYQKLEAQLDGRFLSPLLDLAGVDILLNGGSIGASPKTTLVTSSATLGDKPATLTTNSSPEKKDAKGVTYQNVTKLWVDAATGLPLRRTEGVIVNGKESVFQDLTFDKIDFNSKIEIVWKAPQGASEGEPSTLLKPGAIAPNFSAVGPGGKTVHLSDFKGKVVVLDFWATWCVPCQKAMPHLQHITEELKGRNDVVVLGVCVWDKKDAYDQWVSQKKGTYSFQTVFDLAGRGTDSIATKLFQVQGIPTQYVIDKDGKIADGYIAVETKVKHLELALAKLGISVN